MDRSAAITYLTVAYTYWIADLAYSASACRYLTSALACRTAAITHRADEEAGAEGVFM